MFTGIVEEVGIVKAAGPTGMSIAAALVLTDAHLGDSICVNGACLTITRRDADSFDVDTVPETLRRTNLGTLNTGSPVNLERSLAANGRFGGHFVQGHVEGTGTILDVQGEGEAWVVTIQAPDNVQRNIVEKGFVAVDGISLTIVDRLASSFRVTLIPFTLTHTIANTWAEGTTVNLESDIVAKYVAAQVSGYR
jgi:riboflavin synthase